MSSFEPTSEIPRPTPGPPDPPQFSPPRPKPRPLEVESGLKVPTYLGVMLALQVSILLVLMAMLLVRHPQHNVVVTIDGKQCLVIHDGHATTDVLYCQHP